MATVPHGQFFFDLFGSLFGRLPLILSRFMIFPSVHSTDWFALNFDRVNFYSIRSSVDIVQFGSRGLILNLLVENPLLLHKENASTSDHLLLG